MAIWSARSCQRNKLLTWVLALAEFIKPAGCVCVHVCVCRRAHTHTPMCMMEM